MSGASKLADQPVTPLAPTSDIGVAIGMTVPFAGLDLEQALDVVSAQGFEAVEVFVGHLGPRIVEAPVFEAHATAAGEHVRSRGLAIATLNCIVGDFDPFSSPETFERTADGLSRNLRLAAAIGAPKVLIWDGELNNPELLAGAPEALARCIAAGIRRCELEAPPSITVELHPNTFALRYRRHEETAAALRTVGAGVCLDFCHAAVALGANFASVLSDAFVGAVTHVHYADSDCQSEQLHFPPGAGQIDLAAAESRLRGRGLPVAWDLFGWPAPRQAMAATMDRYRAAVDIIGARRPVSKIS